MSNNSLPPSQVDELIDLAKIAASLRRHWMLLSICIMVCLISAATIWTYTPLQWKAYATLQIGQLPLNITGQLSVQPTTLIETTTQAAARFTQRQLQDQALTMLGLPLDPLGQDKRIQLLRKSLKATAGVNTNFVEVSVAAYSAESAKAYLHAAINVLRKVHDKRQAPLLKNLDDRIAHNLRQIAAATNEKTHLEASLESSMKSAILSNQTKFEPRVLAMNLISIQNDLIHNLSTEQATLMDLRTETNTFPTMIINAIYTPTLPYSPPQLGLFLAFGCLMGLILGIIAALFIDRKTLTTTSTFTTSS